MTLEQSIMSACSPIAPTYPRGSASPAQRPRLTFTRVVDVDNGHLSGAGPQRIRTQIEAWADTWAEARSLADQAESALRTALVVGAVTGIPDDFDADTKLHRVGFDVSAWTS